jgi:hypothetical protein
VRLSFHVITGPGAAPVDEDMRTFLQTTAENQRKRMELKERQLAIQQNIQPPEVSDAQLIANSFVPGLRRLSDDARDRVVIKIHSLILEAQRTTKPSEFTPSCAGTANRAVAEFSTINVEDIIDHAPQATSTKRRDEVLDTKNFFERMSNMAGMCDSDSSQFVFHTVDD